MFSSKLTTKKFQTKRALEFITITKIVQDAIIASKIKQGIVVVQSHHTTARLWVNENEKNLIGSKTLPYVHDMKRILNRFADPNEQYFHNDVRDSRNPKGVRDTHLCPPNGQGVCNECINGHSHAQALILPHAVTMIIKNGKLLKGVWQEIMLIELDHDREREISILVQGETQ